jgi:ketosteroid isomerase-like protein
MISRIRFPDRSVLLFTLPALLLTAPVRASIPTSSVADTDKTFAAAVVKNDKPAADSVLDSEFTWTARSGKTWNKGEVLQTLGSLGAGPDEQLTVADYGKVVVIRGSHAISAQNVSVRFVRVWVQRPAGWKLLVYQETIKAEKTPEKRSGFGSPSGGAPVSCDNPCKTVPYKPDNAAEQEVVSMWQAVERTVLTNDVDAWIPNFTDDFLFVTPDGGEPLNKADRVTMIKELKRTNTTLIPAEVVSMQVWVFGDTAVMRSEHKPRQGRVLHVTRIFKKYNGHWQIAFGQQTAVEAGA